MAKRRVLAAKTGRALFKAFLDENRLRASEAAVALGVTKAAVSHWIHGTEPGESSRELIETWTDGKVPRDSWGPLTDRRKKPKKVIPFKAAANSANKGVA